MKEVNVERNVAILWDIQNVIPSKDNATLFIDGLTNYVNSTGNLSYSLAVGDWMGNVASNVPLVLSEKGFELLYIPQINHKGKKTKDSVDFILITKATEMVFQYPHIDTYVILAGDVDYRPLLQLLKKHGKTITMIYNPDNVSERLLEFADNYLDYRDLLPDESDEYDDTTPERGAMKKEDAFDLLVEAIGIMEKNNKIATPGSIKVKMTMMSEAFNGQIEGINSWLGFIYEAKKKKLIQIQETNNNIRLSLYNGNNKKKQFPEIIKLLIETMEEINPENEWMTFTQISNLMVDRHIRIKAYGYSKFKKLVLDAENRGLVVTKTNGLKWFTKIK